MGGWDVIALALFALVGQMVLMARMPRRAR
jgi:hypothetical protein